MNRFRSRHCALIACLFVSSLTPIAHAQSDRDRAAARTAADAGADAFEAGKFDQALELFSRAEALVHAPPHLLFMARSQEKLGKLVEARETYLKLAGERLPAGAPSAFRNAQAKAETELNAVEGRLAYVTISVRGDEGNRAVVSMDNLELPSAMIGIPIPADPGTHVFSARTDRARSSEVSVTLREGAKQGVELSLTEAITPPAGSAAGATGSAGATIHPTTPPSDVPSSSGGGSRTQSILGYVSIGVGAILGGVATGMLVSSSSSRQEADDKYAECNPRECTPDEKADIKTIDDSADSKLTLAIAGFAVGGAAIIGGIVLVATDSSGSSSGSTSPWQRPNVPHVRLVAGPTWIGAAGSF